MARMSDAFYARDGDDFVASAHTRGPWSSRHQHGGPPAPLAALARTARVAIGWAADDPPLPPPERGRPFEFPFFNEPVSYHAAMETRLVRGEWGSGRAAAWMRQRMPLVADTPTSPLERVLVAADSGSGVSAAIEHKR